MDIPMMQGRRSKNDEKRDSFAQAEDASDVPKATIEFRCAPQYFSKPTGWLRRQHGANIMAIYGNNAVYAANHKQVATWV